MRQLHVVARLLSIYGMHQGDSAVVCIVGDIERILFDWIMLEQK